MPLINLNNEHGRLLDRKIWERERLKRKITLLDQEIEILRNKQSEGGEER